MKAQTNFDFGHILAYLLPGFVGVLALAYISPRIAIFLADGISKDTSTGAFMVLLLSSLTVGVVLSAVRAQILDWVQTSCCWDKTRDDWDYALLKDEKTLAAFQEVLANIYRFSQFYGNMCVAICLLVALKIYDIATSQANWKNALRDQSLLLILLIVTLFLLFVAHRRQLWDTYVRTEQLLIPRGNENGEGEEEGVQEAGRQEEDHQEEGVQEAGRQEEDHQEEDR